MSLLGLVARRLGAAVPTILGVATVVFFVLRVLPGDPVDLLLGETAAPADREALRAALGLHQPLGEQYGRFLVGIFRADLGTSLRSREPVTKIVLAHAPATVALAAAAALFAVSVALPLGILAALRPAGWIDAASSGLALAGASLPNFVLGPALVFLFAIRLGWFPVSGAETPASVVLPAATLGLGAAGILARLVRSAMLEALAADFVRTARAKGLPERVVAGRHALRNALLGAVTVFGLQLGGLLGGAIVTETIFAWPGLGRYITDALMVKDMPAVLGGTTVVGAVYVGLNMISDLLYRLADPRAR